VLADNIHLSDGECWEVMVNKNEEKCTSCRVQDEFSYPPVAVVSYYRLLLGKFYYTP
jgi:hypothetical protein